MGGAIRPAESMSSTPPSSRAQYHLYTMDDAVEEERDQEKSRRCTRKTFLSWGPGWKLFTWFCVLAAYLLFGGLIFTLAERPNEVDSVAQVTARREELQRVLDEAKDNVTAELTARNETLTESEAAELVDRVANVSASLALALEELQSEASPLWTYSTSLFFCATIVTTIGQ